MADRTTGTYRPWIIVTTSHRPNQRLRSFAKDLAAVLPFAIKVNRGKSSLRDLFHDAVSLGARRVVIVSTWKGNPGTIRVYEPTETLETGLREVLHIRLRGATLRREIPGSVKIIHTRRAAISIEGLPGTLQYIADSFTRGFLYKTVYSENEYQGYDVIAKPVFQGEAIRVEFICPSHRAPCGPVLRIIRIDDYDSGFRFHRARAWIETTS